MKRSDGGREGVADRLDVDEESGVSPNSPDNPGCEGKEVRPCWFDRMGDGMGDARGDACDRGGLAPKENEVNRCRDASTSSSPLLTGGRGGPANGSAGISSEVSCGVAGVVLMSLGMGGNSTAPAFGFDDEAAFGIDHP